MDIQDEINNIKNDILLAKRFNGQIDGWRRRPELCELTIKVATIRLNRLQERINEN